MDIRTHMSTLTADTAAQELLDRFNVKIDEIPVVICSGKSVLRNPTTQQLAQCLGLSGKVDESRILDVAIVGAGPAGSGGGGLRRF